MLKKISSASLDLASGMRRYELVVTLGWHDVRQRYRRSTLGPFWLTMSMGVTIAVIGVVFSQLFKAPIRDYVPFLAIGMIMWTFISTTITESCSSFVASDLIIKQLPIPLFVHVLRVIWRNLVIMAHNAIIYPLVLLATGGSISFTAFLSILGIFLIVLNLTWVCLFLAVICTRYRDLPQIIISLLQVIFYLTPIMWVPELLPAKAAIFLLDLNPFYHLFQLVREPLLGEYPNLFSWYVGIISCLLGWLLTFTLYARYRLRIAYWL
jgi:lipopolysaccharide transport system permease protein